MDTQHSFRLSRRALLKSGLVAAGATLGSAALGGVTLTGPRGIWHGPSHALAEGACSVGGEPMPISPLILAPFTDPLPIPQPLVPATLADMIANGLPAPNPVTGGLQDADGGIHQVGVNALGLPNPILYLIKLQVRAHSFTSSQVQVLVSYTDVNGNLIPAGTVIPGLPPSTIYGFNGTFPGPMINAEYGKLALVRFVNELDQNPFNLNRGDFGAPDWAFLTHLHNGHTAPESDGNPNYKPGAYTPGKWVDNLYLNYPAGGDDDEKQSYFWFHDHRMDHTGANVYKGMVGLYPIYDPVLDFGDETDKRGLRLPGLRTNNADGTFGVKYDIPLAIYDCALDDGATPHQDIHIPANECGLRHPEQWGKTFFRHYPNHGFVGDIFTVNGKAFPYLVVERRKYRFRFLDASIARCYELMLMSGHPVADAGTQGQYQLPDGQQCMRFIQIASEGGLLPRPLVRDSFQIWPAKRREVVVDFTRYMDKTPTKPGDVIYLVNTLEMEDGRKPDFNAPGAILGYKVPIMKIIIGGDPPQPDVSDIPNNLRRLPKVPTNVRGLPFRRFVLKRSGTFGGEFEWLINDEIFDPTKQLALPKLGSAEVWEIVNGGGGWVHPLHIHMEEHQVIARNGSTNPHPDDESKEDVVALDPGESVLIYRQFRTFTGPYVCHCHNLAHEDHAMMFGWTIVP
ncbi:MAG: multicopper oxidase domain-containing protein [Chloroflexi bacterium]|nr:multicopper oxidase domain-containing protein [Chloroflexota bacterium]